MEPKTAPKSHCGATCRTRVGYAIYYIWATWGSPGTLPNAIQNRSRIRNPFRSQFLPILGGFGGPLGSPFGTILALFWGSVLTPFVSLWQLWALSWGTLLPSCCLLVPRASKREVQERPRAAQELPKGLEEFQERPRGSQESPGEFQNRPKTTPIFRTRGKCQRNPLKRIPE